MNTWWIFRMLNLKAVLISFLNSFWKVLTFTRLYYNFTNLHTNCLWPVRAYSTRADETCVIFSEISTVRLSFVRLFGLGQVNKLLGQDQSTIQPPKGRSVTDPTSDGNVSQWSIQLRLDWSVTMSMVQPCKRRSVTDSVNWGKICW